MTILSPPFPWVDFFRFVTQLVGIVATAIALPFVAIAAGVRFATITRRLSLQRAQALRVIAAAAIVILPTTIVVLIAQSTATVPIALLVLAGSFCFAITAATTELDISRKKKDGYVQ